jgi:hypothetical protein
MLRTMKNLYSTRTPPRWRARGSTLFQLPSWEPFQVSPMNSRMKPADRGISGASLGGARR